MIYNCVIQINICHAQHPKDFSHTTCQTYLPQTKSDYLDTHSQIAIKRYSTTERYSYIYCSFSQALVAHIVFL